MKGWRTEFTSVFKASPMTFWVHDGGGNAARAVPKPHPVPGLGFARYLVEFDGVQFEFSSTDELRECLRVLSQRNLPTTVRLSDHSLAGPNGHWLSRLPAQAKPWRYRERLVPYLTDVLDQLAAAPRSQ
jgi:hypothetical protein